MFKPLLLIPSALVLLGAFLLLGTVPATADQPGAETAGLVYVCGCGLACDCATIADRPGACPCGKPLIEKQVLKEDADRIYVCACPEECRCGLHPGDPAKCACGHELRAYPKPTGMVVDCPHAAPGVQPPCADCPKQADCAGCPKVPAKAEPPPCPGCPHHADCPGCPQAQVPASPAPCGGCPQMPAAAR